MALLLLLLAGLLASPGEANRKCYYPDGSDSPTDFACDEKADNSPCCGAPHFGGTCLSNGLCLGTDGIVSRGSCTDPTWQSPECPSVCIKGAETLGARLDHCTNITTADVWCCDPPTPNCCAQPALQLTLGSSPPFTWASYVDSPTASYTVVKPRSSSSSSTSTSSTATTTTTTTTNTNTPSPTTSHATSPSPTTSANNPPTPPAADAQQSQSSPGLSTGAQAGIGVGAAAGALLLLLAAYLFWRLHRKTKALEEALNNNSQWGDGTQAPTIYSPAEPKAELAVGYAGYPAGPPPFHTHAELPDEQYAELPAWR